jgi:serine/threonine protein kinase
MDVVANRYILEQKLGSGGVASVYRAKDQSLGRIRAIKLLASQHDEEQRARLRDEARAMANLDHPNICRVLDVGFDGNRDFIVMEYAEGGSLERVVDEQGPMTPKAAIEVIIQVLLALEHAHNAGVIHRDVKPENILVAQQGTYWLCDFGIALITTEHDRLTRTGMAMGSLPYMPPEQRRDPRSVGAAADQYAAGATLFYLLTGNNPVDLYLTPHLSPRWHGIPVAVGDVIRVATAARPSDRYPDVASLRRALVRAMERGRQPDEFAAATDPLFRFSVRPKNHALVMAITSIFLAVAVSAVIVFDLQRSHAEHSHLPLDARSRLPTDLAGRWLGSWNGVPGARLNLKGTASNLTGEMWVPLGDDQLRTRVAGHYDASSRVLTLRDVGDTTTPGVYSGQLEDAMFLKGTFKNDIGGLAQFALVRVSEGPEPASQP